MSKLIDLTNQNFGYWHVIERGPNNKSGQAQWLCKCTLCGKTIKLVQGGHLRAGRSTSCGCTKMEKMRQASIKQETGKIYGYLEVKRMATIEEKPRNVESIYWVCDCLKCGRKNVIIKGDYLRNGDTKSCGCLTSKNESLIASMLDSLQINYKTQYTFSDLTSTERASDKLMFDFAIFNKHSQELLYLLEYDGIQHFDSQHTWAKSNNYNKIIQNDELKNQYCFNHNIPLIRIPYDLNYTLEDLILETTKFLLTKDNEKDYYKRRF